MQLQRLFLTDRNKAQPFCFWISSSVRTSSSSQVVDAVLPATANAMVTAHPAAATYVCELLARDTPCAAVWCASITKPDCLRSCCQRRSLLNLHKCTLPLTSTTHPRAFLTCHDVIK